MSLQIPLTKPGGFVAVAMSGKPLFPTGTEAEGVLIAPEGPHVRITAYKP
jgi:hypothetical protein